MSARAWFAARYLRVDPRTAAIFRIALGSLCFFDTLRHAREAAFLYSNDGVLTNHMLLYRPLSGYSFSIFNAFSSLTEVRLLFALGLLTQLALVIGFRSRLMAVLNLVFITSRDTRMLFIENGGYIVENLACFWACFLPLERRFSIDAWRASWRARKETSLAELAVRSDEAALSAPVTTLAGLAVLSNLAIIYFFNVINKTGHIWRTGDTIHYVLHINRMVTGLGVFVRETFPEPLLKAADFSVLAVEAFIFVCIVSPRARAWARLLAIALIFALHATLGTFMRLGPFSWFLIGWSTLLLLPVHFDYVNRFLERRLRPAVLGVDEHSALSMTCARIVKRLDRYSRFTFVAAPSGQVLAVRAGDGEPFVWHSDARHLLDAVFAALPLGRVVARLSFGLPTRLLGFALERRERVERFFGLDTAPAPEAVPSAVQRLWLKARVTLRETLLVYLIGCATLQAWQENKVIPAALPPKLKEGQVMRDDERKAYELIKRWLGDTVIPLKFSETPKFLSATVGYPRIFQGWGMFAPNPIQEDGVLAVDATTVDGRHIDPLTGAAPDLDLSDSRGEGLSQIDQDYGNRIRFDRNQPYREGLRDYLLRYPERTGRPADELVSVDVYWVRCKCPKPGQTKATDNDAVPILSWRKPGYVPAAGQKPLPPQPKLRSAEKDGVR